MNNSDTVLLQRILDAIEQVESYTRGMSEREFRSRCMVQDAAIRQIEIISAAASNISLEFQAAHSKLPWSKIIAIRKKIVPENFSVNPANIWNVIQDDLPLHKQALKKIV